jgi:chromate transporter
MSLAPTKSSEISAAFLKLGVTSFGGPVAHLGYFHREIVIRRRWLSEESYAELVGLGQFLPGPASSQVAFAIGLARGGWWGGVAAWSAFTLPSALAMILFASIIDRMAGPVATHVVHGLKLVAIPIVAQALIDMTGRLAPDFTRRMLALVAIALTVAAGTPLTQLLTILAGGLAGAWLCRADPGPPLDIEGWRPTARSGAMCLLLFASLFILLPLAASASALMALADIFYRSGALVFGGGHVVLPLLRAELVPHWMSDASFLAGYGAAQAMPGPLFTLAAYLGVVAMPGARLAAAMISVIALSLPGLLLMAGMLPFHARLREKQATRGAVAGVNAVVVGILAAALYTPLWTTGIADAGDVLIILAGFGLLVIGRWPPLAIVLITAGMSVARLYLG